MKLVEVVPGIIRIRAENVREIVELAKLDDGESARLHVKGRFAEMEFRYGRNGLQPSAAPAPVPSKAVLSPGKLMALKKARAALAAKHGKMADKSPKAARLEAMNAERISLYRQGLTDRQIGEKLGTTHTAISQWRNVRKLKPNIPQGGGHKSAAPRPFARRTG